MKLDILNPASLDLHGCPMLQASFYFTSFSGESNRAGLTESVALEIFRWIKWESDVKAFLTHEFVVIPAAVALLVAGCFIPPIGIVLMAARVVVAITAVLVIIASIADEGELSGEYAEESLVANSYIEALDPTMRRNSAVLTENRRFVVTPNDYCDFLF